MPGDERKVLIPLQTVTPERAEDVLVGAALMWMVTRGITHPIVQLTDAAENVARDRYLRNRESLSDLGVTISSSNNREQSFGRRPIGSVSPNGSGASAISWQSCRR